MGCVVHVIVSACILGSLCCCYVQQLLLLRLLYSFLARDKRTVSYMQGFAVLH